MLPWAGSLKHQAPRTTDTLVSRLGPVVSRGSRASAVLRQVIRRRLGQVSAGQQSGGRNKTFKMTKNVEFSDLVNYSDLHMYATFQIPVSILRM